MAIDRAVVPRHVDDVELLSLVASADPEAARRLVLRLMTAVRRRVASVLRDPADQDDATQLALLAILRASRTFRGESTVERWADAIAVRTAMRVANQRGRGSGRIDTTVDPEQVPSPAASVPANESTARPVMQYLEAVAEPFRTVVYLRHVRDLSIDEIAERTAASPNTVKKRLSRGRELLRQMIRRDCAAVSPGTGRH